jgi:hypothetical protein
MADVMPVRFHFFALGRSSPMSRYSFGLLITARMRRSCSSSCIATARGRRRAPLTQMTLRPVAYRGQAGSESAMNRRRWTDAAPRRVSGIATSRAPHPLLLWRGIGSRNYFEIDAGFPIRLCPFKENSNGQAPSSVSGSDRRERWYPDIRSISWISMRCLQSAAERKARSSSTSDHHWTKRENDIESRYQLRHGRSVYGGQYS